MKSRWTTYLLLAAVTAVWGVVAWRILAPPSAGAPSSAAAAAVSAVPVFEADTLLLDYADPFLKESAPSRHSVRVPVRTLPVRKPPGGQRSKTKLVHLGTISSGGQPLYILAVGNEQYELTRGGTAGEFAFAGCDGDSLYLYRNGTVYGVGLCQ